MGANNWLTALAVTVSHLPIGLVCLAGIVMAVLRRREVPLVAGLAATGFGGLLLLNIVLPLVQVVVWPLIASSRPATPALYSALSLVSTLGAAGCYALLIGAIFAGRR